MKPLPGLTALLTMAPSAFSGDDLELPRIRNLAALRREVVAWGRYCRMKLSGADVEALVGWLNRNFYRLKK